MRQIFLSLDFIFVIYYTYQSLIVLAVQDKQIRLNNLIPNGHMLPVVEINGSEFVLNGWL